MAAGKTLVRCTIRWCRYNKAKQCVRSCVVVSFVTLAYSMPTCCSVKAMSKEAWTAKRKKEAK